MKCVYCFQDDETRFRGVEHVVPQSFGKFGSSTPTLDCVCDDCNCYFGRELDQLLARETLEGISRYTHGQFSRERRPQKRLDIALAEGPEVGPFAGLRVSVDGTTGKLMRPRAQFHAFNFQTKQNEVYFIEQIAGLALPEPIYGAPGKNGTKGTWRVKTYAASKEEYDALLAALQANGIDFQPGEPFQMPQSNTEEGRDEPTFPVEIQGEVDTLHKRALGKILMNFVTWTLGCDEALKPRWDSLRNYVRHAEGQMKARLTERPFWNGQETETHRFEDDSIDIRIENLGGNIVGAIQFYGQFSYQMILVEAEALPTNAEIGYRFTAGSEPVRGEKLQVYIGPNGAASEGSYPRTEFDMPYPNASRLIVVIFWTIVVVALFFFGITVMGVSRLETDTHPAVQFVRRVVYGDGNLQAILFSIIGSGVAAFIIFGAWATTTLIVFMALSRFDHDMVKHMRIMVVPGSEWRPQLTGTELNKLLLKVAFFTVISGAIGALLLSLFFAFRPV